MPELIFNNTPGQATRVTLENGSVPGSIFVEGTDVFTQGSVIITEFQASLQVHQQIQTSLGQGIYILTFGDKPSTVRIGGLCFTGICGGSAPTSGGTGIDQVLQYYAQNKASAGNASNPLPLITIKAGQSSFTGSLIACDVSSGPAKTRLSKFNLTLQTFPVPLSR